MAWPVGTPIPHESPVGWARVGHAETVGAARCPLSWPAPVGDRIHTNHAGIMAVRPSQGEFPILLLALCWPLPDAVAMSG